MSDYRHNDDVSSALNKESVSSCAVLVIDELGDPTEDGAPEVLLEPTKNTARILEAARKKGVPVIFCNDAHYQGIDRELELWGDHNLHGSPQAQPSPQLGLTETDFVIEKPRYSAFFQTRLRLLLQELGIDTLILTGFDTNICVQHTAADAYFNNYKIALVEDATASFLVGNHEDGLDYMQKCYAAEIVTTDEVVDLLS